MTAANRDASIETIIRDYEGGYVDDPRDRGGETNYGITKAVARANGYTGDMKTLPLDTAVEIYRRNYWRPIQGDKLPPGPDFATFDYAVNSGVSRGAKGLQKAVGAKVDGLVGSETIFKAKTVDPVATVKAICAERLSFLQALKNWRYFGKGWGRRVADVEARGVKMAMEANGRDPITVSDTLRGEGIAALAQSKKEATKATAAPVAGGGFSIADIPHWVLWGIGIAAALAVVIFVYRYWIHRKRADAYATAAKA